jgi:hypothetical protein
MVRIVEIQPTYEEGSEHLQLDDYYIDDDYISDTPEQDTDTTMKFDNPELPDHVHDTEDIVKMEDEDDIQKERCRFRNAKCVERKQRTLERQQHQPGNLYDFSTTDLRNIINICRDAHNIIITRQQEHVEVEAYSPTNYYIPQDYLSSTWKHKSDTPHATTERPTRGKKTSTSQERFERALHRRCLWHLNSIHSAFECHNLHKAMGALLLKSAKKKDHEGRRPNYSDDETRKN